MKNERYYYGIMQPSEKAAYKLIYEGLNTRVFNLVIESALTPTQIQEIYLKVLYDNPLFYYINQTVIRMTSQQNQHVLLPEYLYTGSEIENINQDIRNVVNRVAVKARNMRTNEFRLEKYLHDTVIKSVAYDYDSLNKANCNNAHSIVGAFLDKRAVCEGIAKAFKLLCNEYAIKCIVVLGKADPKGIFDNESYHAWNLVKINDESYHVDVTWDNLFDNEIRHISYDYFNVTTEDILIDHRPFGNLPFCSATSLNYFSSTKSIVHSFEELLALVKQRIRANSIMFKACSDRDEFYALDELKRKTFLALTYASLSTGVIKEYTLLFNEAHKIGKIIFLPDDKK